MTNLHIPTRHDANIIAKATRAMAAIEHLVQHSIIPSPEFWPSTRIEGLEWIERTLFDSTTSEELAAAIWAAVGCQDAILNGRKKATDFGSSRPYIAMGLRSRIESLSIEDPFAGLID
jgi:hypothetical protein